MTAEIYIVSGFLGAGKTTLIQKLLKEAFRGERVVLLENDFGEVSVDAALLRAGGAEVAELRAGCICCSLAGDLIKTLKMMLARYEPDKIIIEPSGVAKLSDVEAACADAGVRARAAVKRKLTVVDALRCKSYLENFGEFFADQIGHADAVLLSRAEERPGAAEAACESVRALNARAPIFCEPWERVRAADLLFLPKPPNVQGGAGDVHGNDHAHAAHDHVAHDHDHVAHDHDHGAHDHDHGAHDHDHGAHDHDHGAHDHAHAAHDHDHDAHDHDHDAHDHDHDAEEVFDVVTIRTDRAFDAEDLKARALRMAEGAGGTVLRAKGILRGTDGRLNLQYLPEDARVEPCAVTGADGDNDAISVIGRDLNGPALAALFGGTVIRGAE